MKKVKRKWWTKWWDILIIIFIILICALFPVIINAITLIPNSWIVNNISEPLTHLFDEPTKWTEVWAEYGGALLSAGIALVILYKQQKQNQKLNEFNRNLQIKALKYQDKYNWYTHLKSEFSNLTCAWNLYFIKGIAIKIGEFYNNNNINEDTIKEITSSIEEDINKKLSELDFLQISCKYLFPDYDLDKNEKEIWKEIDSIQNKFYDVLYNLKWIIISLPHSNSEKRISSVEDIKKIVNKDYILKEYKLICNQLKVFNYDFYNNSNEIIFSIFSIFESLTEKRALPVFKLLQYEREKIEKLLDEEEINKNLNAN